ncbi:MAG: CocE/NonD family hydrolase [Candidatus Hydrogenedentes bacterium]|nr:CocE/NonD family hydrolase [Candidatus Hydrogenedentota bacterium]
MAMRLRLLLFAVVFGLLLGPLASSETVMVPMKDGVKLATDVTLPASGGPAFPVVLVRTVYNKAQGAGVAPIFNAAGMALVIQDTRGRFASEGKDMIFADDGWGEHQDGADTVAWVKQQPWCNGKIGTWGMSALGITQIQMAPATKDVAAQAIIVASSKFYGQTAYQGGVFMKSLAETWIHGQKSDWVIDIWKSHPAYDAYWKGFNAEEQAPKITAPAIHIGGWFDIFQQGTINNFVTRQHQSGQGAKGNQKLVIGPWPHGPSKRLGDLDLKDNFNKFDMNMASVRFLQYWLKGEDNGIMKEPAVNYYTLGDVVTEGAPGNEWRTADDWPPFPTKATSYYLVEGGKLGNKPADTKGSATYSYDPKDPCPTKGGQNLTIPAGTFDQREVSGRPDVLRFATEPLAAPVEITGHVDVTLYVSTDAPDTDFTAKLVDIYPDGKEILMLDNVRRLKFHKGFDKPEPVKPGEITKLDIDLWSISLIVNKGHRIGVQVSSSNYPRFEKNPNTGDDFPKDDKLRVAKNTVYMDKEHPSAIILPVRAEAAGK